jgi:hypothetical protein
MRFDEYRVSNVQRCRSTLCVIALFVHEHEQRVAKAVDLLPGGLEWARGLWLLDARNFQVDGEAGEVDPTGRAARRVHVFAFKVCVKLVLQVRANCLAIRDPENGKWLVRDGWTRFRRIAVPRPAG